MVQRHARLSFFFAQRRAWLVSIGGRGGGIRNPALMIDAWCTIIHAARPKKEGRVVPLSGLRISQGYLNGSFGSFLDTETAADQIQDLIVFIHQSCYGDSIEHRVRNTVDGWTLILRCTFNSDGRELHIKFSKAVFSFFCTCIRPPPSNSGGSRAQILS